MSLECCSSRSRQRQGAALCPKACSLSHCSSAASSWFAPPFLIRRARQLIPLACTFAQARSSAPSPATNGLYRPKIVGESANFLYLISTFEEKEKERKKPTKLASSRYFISFVVDCVPQKRPTAPGLRAWSPTALLSRPGRA